MPEVKPFMCLHFSLQVVAVSQLSNSLLLKTKDLQLRYVLIIFCMSVIIKGTVVWKKYKIIFKCCLVRYTFVPKFNHYSYPVQVRICTCVTHKCIVYKHGFLPYSITVCISRIKFVMVRIYRQHTQFEWVFIIFSRLRSKRLTSIYFLLCDCSTTSPFSLTPLHEPPPHQHAQYAMDNVAIKYVFILDVFNLHTAH